MFGTEEQTIAAGVEEARRRGIDVTGPAAADTIFLAARNMVIHHMKAMPEDRLLTPCKHPEKGDLVGWRWAKLTIGHCDHHLGQIDAARAGKPWVRVTSADDKLYGAKTNA